MTLTRRERLHTATREEIKTIARQHMAVEGAAALSLRAIARDMGMSAPALYRYYESRDDLITALILDAYNALADRIQMTMSKYPEHDYANRLYAGMLAYRSWAVTYPADYILIFGNPIPGYQAPGEATTQAARRTNEIFFQELQNAWQANALTIPTEYTELIPQFHEQIVGDPHRYGGQIPQPLLEILLTVWCKLHGMISLELYSHLQPIIGNPGELYRFEVLVWLRRMGLNPDQ
ncbi:MAG: TetR/AcrR family transcriptional regulator [Chloroflexota bacterium]